jgi:glycosyltransferase involved in cell wall biosynthesis
MNVHRESRSALVFAAPPPPLGGVASIVQMLQSGLASHAGVNFGAPMPKLQQAAGRSLSRPVRNVWRLIASAVRVPPGSRVLLFSSAGFSFYEKAFWACLVLVLQRKPVIAMVDGNFPAFWQRQSKWAQWLASRILHAKALRLGVQSAGWADVYRGMFPRADVQVFAATVNEKFWQAKPSAGRRAGQVLYVGWMIPEKGLLDLLDAFVQVRHAVHDARLRLVGPLFGDEAFWRDQMDARDLAACVDVVGPIHGHAALVQELSTASVFVLPSHAEGMPVALLEAMALGVPCIGTRVGAIPDMLEQGAAGYVVSPRAPQELATAMRRLLLDAPLAQRLGHAAFERARVYYSKEAFARSFLQLLDIT